MNKDTIKKWFENHFTVSKKIGKSIPFFNEYYAQYPNHVCCTAHLPQNYKKNHHPHIALPFDNNQIVSIDEYLNASPMQIGCINYIATQGPRKNTFDAFWKMIWYEKCKVIVSVTNLFEGTKKNHIVKFDAFWPEAKKAQNFGQFRVESLKEEVSDRFTSQHAQQLLIRHLKMTYENQEHNVVHLHLENWPDDGIVEAESLWELVQETDVWRKDKPVVVHCAAGIGRTGTFIATHSLYHDMLRAFNTMHVDEKKFNIPDAVYAMRKYRYGAMIAWEEQYLLVIETLELILKQLLKKV
ncbi:MAG: dual specificity protein phosphatase family protein [Parachlamydiales bacterium]|nr:dual specificity protein phosphatase family protein [Parachlamydiales bacterium]